MLIMCYGPLPVRRWGVRSPGYLAQTPDWLRKHLAAPCVFSWFISACSCSVGAKSLCARIAIRCSPMPTSLLTAHRWAPALTTNRLWNRTDSIWCRRRQRAPRHRGPSLQLENFPAGTHFFGVVLINFDWHQHLSASELKCCLIGVGWECKCESDCLQILSENPTWWLIGSHFFAWQKLQHRDNILESNIPGM